MAATPAPPRRAIVWVSGLAQHTTDQSAEGFARRLAVETDWLDPSSAEYEVRTRSTVAATEAVLPGDAACTIVRTLGGAERYADVYALATEDVLVGRLRRGSLFAKLAVVGGVLLRHVTTLARFVSTRGKTRRERAQVLYAVFVALLLVIAFVGLFAALAGTFAAGDIPWLPMWAEGLVLGFGGLTIWKSKIFSVLADGGLLAAKLMRYLDRPGKADRELRGQLYTLLDELGRRGEHDQVDVVAYSFGALVAIDGCFPKTDPPPLAIAQIGRLVTVAMPFDFVRAYWKPYFTGRYGTPPADGWWVNVYTPGDVLSSNFANDPDPQAAPVDGIVLDGNNGAGVPVVTPTNRVYRLDGVSAPASGLKLLVLDGLQMHGRYWDEDHADATVFGKVAQALELAPPPTSA